MEEKTEEMKKKKDELSVHTALSILSGIFSGMAVSILGVDDLSLVGRIFHVVGIAIIGFIIWGAISSEGNEKLRKRLIAIGTLVVAVGILSACYAFSTKFF